ncbi:rhodopsin-like [Haliotis rufescens]|uniref:rhodopsin-like n=1 Tax=Haliotis rufescens TaxID=6454 RepID=UPI00201EA058|nr:rhodopsin-like [Haliotis rufescens]
MDLDNTTNITLRSSESIPNIRFGICLLFLDLGIILGNCVTITVFRRNRTLRSPAGWIIVNIAACDLAIGVLVGVFVLPCVFSGYFPFHESIIQVEGALVLTFFDEAVYGLTLAAVDRYVAICQPYHYVRLFSDTNLLGVFVLTWLYAALVPVVFTFTNGFKYYDLNLDAVCGVRATYTVWSSI